MIISILNYFINNKTIEGVKNHFKKDEKKTKADAANNLLLLEKLE